MSLGLVSSGNTRLQNHCLALLHSLVLVAARNSTHAPGMLGSINIPTSTFQYLHSMSRPCALSLNRSLLVHAVCQTLRILSFSSTQLPSPNYHCRLPELTAIKDMPLHWWGHFIVDLGTQADLMLMLSWF